MKKCLLWMLLLCAAPAPATISAVQSNATWNTSGGSCTVPLTNTVSTHLLVVWATWSPTSLTVSSVTDSATPLNQFTSAVGPTVQPAASTPVSAQLFYAKNINGFSGTDNVIVTFSGTATSASCVAVEYMGADTNYPLDSVSQTISKSGVTSNALDSGTTSPANASLLVFGGGVIDNSSGLIAGSGFTSVKSNTIGTAASAITEQNGSAIATNNVLQRATACLGNPVTFTCNSNTGNWLMQMAVFRAASWTISSGWSTAQTPQVANAGQYPGSDPCVQAQNAEINNNGANIMLPIFGGGYAAQTPCSVDPLGGFSGNGGVLKLTNTGNGNNAVLAISSPVHLGGASLIAEDQRVSDSAGVSLGASSTFGTAAALGVFKNSGTCGSSACSIVITQIANSDAGCYSVAYNDPGYLNIVRGTRPGIQFYDFIGTSGLVQLNNIPRRALAGNGSGSDTWGDPFCATSPNNHADGPSTLSGTAHFGFFAPDAYALGFRGCGSGTNPACGTNAQITNWTPMAWAGAAETDTVCPTGGCGGNTCSSNDTYCALSLAGQLNANVSAAFGAVLKNIGLTANGQPGIGGIFCFTCEEGSWWDNDSSVTVRTPGPDYMVWSGGAGANEGIGGNSSQNSGGIRRIEDYCNGKQLGGETTDCWAAANGEHLFAVLNDNWTRLGLTDITANTCSANDSRCKSSDDPLTQNPYPAVMIDGISAPSSKTSPSGASGPMRVGPIHGQSWPTEFLVGSQEPTKGVEIDSPQANSKGANYTVHISCNFNGHGTCPATGLLTPAGSGNRTSDITVMHANGGGKSTIWDEFENVSTMTDCPGNTTTPGCWTDNEIAFWAMTNCISGDSSCTGAGISLITTSNQFPNQFAGGITMSSANGVVGVAQGCSLACQYLLTLENTGVVVQNSAAASVVEQPNLFKFFNPTTKRLGTTAFTVITTAASSHYDVGVYSISGTALNLIWHTGSLSGSSTGQVTATISSAAILSAGTTYYLAFCTDSTSLVVAGIGGAGGTATNFSNFFGGAGSPANTFGQDGNAADKCSLGVLPSTLTSTNITNSTTQVVVPAVLISN
jgi:hypothetical protein